MSSSESYANKSIASEADSPAPWHHSHRSSREDPSEELRERMASMHMMSGGLGDRDDDFVRPARREACESRGSYGEPRRSRHSGRYAGYGEGGYGRRGHRGGYSSEDPCEERSYDRRMASRLGGGGGSYGRW
jgi:hypothetical protein